MKFNYHNTAKKIGWNFESIKPTLEQKSDYNYYKAVVECITPNTTLLDIGCGSAEKSTRYFSLAKKVYAIDIEPEMLKRATQNANKYYGEFAKDKFEFLLSDGNSKLEFADNTFDVVCSRHCGANMAEVFRVLKPDGVFISEDIDKYDCYALKKYFNRGQSFDKTPPIKQQIFLDCLSAGFSKIELLSFEQIEYYSHIEQLEFLLENTPIINGYDKNTDREILEKYVKDHTCEKGIKLERNLFAFKLIK